MTEELMTITEEAAESSSSMGNMMVKGIFSYTLFGHEFWITNSTVTIYLIVFVLLVFAFICNRVIKKRFRDVPGGFQNVIELLVEKLDNMVGHAMGRNAHRFRNYIGTIFAFILLCNLAGVFGLRSPTADYGTTLPLGILSFLIIQFNAIRSKKLRYLKSLAEPYPFLLPSNIIGEVSVPISLSLRLFGNVLSGTMILSLWYSMVPWFLVMTPASAVLHAYFDIFSGCIQTYVFAMLTMTYVNDKLD